MEDDQGFAVVFPYLPIMRIFTLLLTKTDDIT